MAILDIQTVYAGVSCHPHRISIKCNDDYATITAAGYLNRGSVLTVDTGDFVFIAYGENSESSSIFTVSLDSNSVITLVPYDIAPSSIVNADIAASAAIAFSKLAALSSGNILVGNGSNVPTSVAVTGDIAISDAGVTSIASGAIVNADINASAAIAFSKLATLSSTQILVGSAGNVATAVAVTGDVTISNTGVTAIGSAKVLLAMLASGIAPSHVVKFAGKASDGGGSATITISVAGVVAGDIAFANIQASTNAVTVQKVTPGTDQVVVLLSGDPGASTVVSYQVLRAAS